MRFVVPVTALLAALALAACGSVAAPKPDPAGDAAFVTSLTRLCSETPALVPLDATASIAAISSAAQTNWTTVNGLNAGLLHLTPSLSNATPLAPAITDLAQMLLDMMRRYKAITRAAARNNAKLVQSWVPLAVERHTQALSDLAKIGITSCLS